MNVAKLAPEPRSRNMNGGGPAGAEGEPPNDSFPSLRTAVARSHRTFDVNHLPLDLQRVVADLTEKYDRKYALCVAFTIRTAVELHRGWHMTLLTSKIMQQPVIRPRREEQTRLSMPKPCTYAPLYVCSSTLSRLFNISILL